MLVFHSIYTTKTFLSPSMLPLQALGRAPPIDLPSISLHFLPPHDLTNGFKDMLEHLSNMSVTKLYLLILLHQAPANLLSMNQFRHLGLPYLMSGL